MSRAAPNRLEQARIPPGGSAAPIAADLGTLDE